MPLLDNDASEVLVSVRPEAVSLAVTAGEAPGDGSGTPATVRQVLYHGQATHVYAVLDNGEPLVAFLPNRHGEKAPSAFAPGGRVWASWPPESSWVVADT